MYLIRIYWNEKYSEEEVELFHVGPFDDETAAITWRDRFMKKVPKGFREDDYEKEDGPGSKSDESAHGWVTTKLVPMLSPNDSMEEMAARFTANIARERRRRQERQT